MIAQLDRRRFHIARDPASMPTTGSVFSFHKFSVSVGQLTAGLKSSAVKGVELMLMLSYIEQQTQDRCALSQQMSVSSAKAVKSSCTEQTSLQLTAKGVIGKGGIALGVRVERAVVTWQRRQTTVVF